MKTETSAALSSAASGESGFERLAALLIMITAAALMVFLAVQNRAQINPDGIAYIRIARYMAEGRWDLVLSGYWAPLISWMMIPLRGLDPAHGLVGARAVLVLSGIVFLLGTRALLQRLDLSARARIFALGITAIYVAIESAMRITPDLLVGGLLLFLFASLFGSCWIKSPGMALRAGAIGGLAYYAKAMALPYAAGAIIAFATLRAFLGCDAPARAFRAARFALLGLALASLPWIIVLSVHYGKPVFSTSGSINHALIGPDAEELRIHPIFSRYHEPDAGRITSWEEPPPSDYDGWSPFASFRNFRYQISNVYTNLGAVRLQWTDFDAIGFGLFCLVAAFVFRVPWREGMRAERWRWGLLPAGLLALLYLPVHASQERYFYIAYPLMIAATMGIVEWVAAVQCGGRGRMFGTIFATLLFLFPVARRLPDAAVGAYAETGRLAASLAREHIGRGGGPIASVDDQTGLYTAFHADVPWLGTERALDIDRLMELRPGLVVLGGGPVSDDEDARMLRDRGLTAVRVP